MYSPEQKTGSEGELWAYEQLVKRGHKVKMMGNFYHLGCDMMIGNLPIEVKFARPTLRTRVVNDSLAISYRRWQWHVAETSQNMSRDWVLILIAQDSKMVRHPYILPGGMLQGRTHLQVTSHPDRYTGWINDWRNQWDVIPFLMQQTYLDNGPTYHQWLTGQRIVA